MSVNRVNPSHLRPEPFFVDGKDRGVHYIAREGQADDHYVVAVDVAGHLPRLVIRPRFPGFAVGDAVGVTQRMFPTVPFHPVDVHLVAASPGDGFPAALCRDLRAAALLGEHAGRVDLVEIATVGTAARLLVKGGEPQLTLDLAEALVDSADRIAASGTAFPDASLARIGVSSDAEVSPETIERLAAHLTETAHWLSGASARVGDAVEAHLTLDETGDDLRGVLRFAWRDSACTVVDASLDAALPKSESKPLALEPQKGPWARIRALAELRVGDAELDSAWLIEGDPRQAPLVLTAREHFNALATVEARVQIEADAVRVQVPPRTRNFVDVHLVGETLLLLWRRLAIVRAGHALVETPETFD